MADNLQREIEDKIIDCINSGVGGRLIVSKLEKAPGGINLSVERRGEYKEEPMYFRVVGFVVPEKETEFIKDFPQEDFRGRKDFHLLFAPFNEISQKLSDYIWLVPAFEFKDIAENIKSSDAKNIFRFQAQPDTQLNNRYSRFIIFTNQLGKLILDAFEKGGKFDFSEAIRQENKVNIDNLKEFLVQARQNTYAASATPVDNPRLISSIQLEFQKGDYFYRDIYFSGDKKFIGQEIIYLDSKPVWGVNYIGTAQGAPLGKIETAFLKEALFKLVETCRVGQSCEYEKRGLKYQDRGKGSLDEFFGEEEIVQNGKSIYKLNYQGGLI